MNGWGSRMEGGAQQALSADFSKSSSHILVHECANTCTNRKVDVSSHVCGETPARLLQKSEKHFLPLKKPNLTETERPGTTKAAPEFAVSHPCVLLSESNEKRSQQWKSRLISPGV